MKKILRSLLMLLLVQQLTLPFLFAEESEWKLFKDDNNVKCYARDEADTKLKQFKATGVINSKVGLLRTITDDAESYLSWYPDCLECRLITRKDDTLYFYIVLNSPFPTKNRDVVVTVDVETNYRTGFYKGMIKGVDQTESFYLVPENPKNVRVFNLKASMEAQAISDSQCIITWVQSVDVESPIPNAFTDLVSRTFPYRAILGMREIVTQDKWIQKGMMSDDGKRYEKYFYNQLDNN